MKPWSTGGSRILKKEHHWKCDSIEHSETTAQGVQVHLKGPWWGPEGKDPEVLGFLNFHMLKQSFFGGSLSSLFFFFFTFLSSPFLFFFFLFFFFFLKFFWELPKKGALACCTYTPRPKSAHALIKVWKSYLKLLTSTLTNSSPRVVSRMPVI